MNCVCGCGAGVGLLGLGKVSRAGLGSLGPSGVSLKGFDVRVTWSHSRFRRRHPGCRRGARGRDVGCLGAAGLGAGSGQGSHRVGVGGQLSGQVNFLSILDFPDLSNGKRSFLSHRVILRV